KAYKLAASALVLPVHSPWFFARVNQPNPSHSNSVMSSGHLCCFGSFGANASAITPRRFLALLQ
ncbi:MAG: hypothetical protein OSA00_04880, partial [Pseudomonadales bacterium]|nr:hypothetical protein [Pseudomonadales bacterium]